MRAIRVDDYWEREECAARLPLPPGDQEQDIFFLWHHSRECYGKNHQEVDIRFQDPGERDYVHCKAFYYVPRIVLTVSATAPVQTDAGTEIGEVLDSRKEGSDHHIVAGLQAWYYRAERILMRWEVDLFHPYR
ncbi:MAG TPA: hypothetical protein VJ464_11270 [Blastocatellia bacterium]|nr:hypothetical protein [Blastocatellia bacterium]